MYLNAQGASICLPVTAAKQSFYLDFVQGAYDSFHAQMGGDHALYYMINFSTVMCTDNVNPAAKQKILASNINNEIGNITVKTDSEGELKMDDYFVHPTFRHQGVMMLHKGEVVYEAYPGMKPTGSNIWMSSSKTLTGLITAMLAKEGKLDMSASTTKYVPELKGTAWDKVTILDLVNHTAGLDHEENNTSILDPEGVFVRFISSALGTTERCETVGTWHDV
ncbi:serine hydrolase domain-containing protein [Vibrio aestuarianus]|uniref:serine hydrolase domain-containing protein n=1 Tax=Vibrio aestuarianus TaxID=28171 RepID=UPI0020B149A5|nr:serine hydrolase domain-containing protein [Vibrio aestuarianus]